MKTIIWTPEIEQEISKDGSIEIRCAEYRIAGMWEGTMQSPPSIPQDAIQKAKERREQFAEWIEEIQDPRGRNTTRYQDDARQSLESLLMFGICRTSNRLVTRTILAKLRELGMKPYAFHVMKFHEGE